MITGRMRRLPLGLRRLIGMVPQPSLPVRSSLR
jgi:hypothetical protein